MPEMASLPLAVANVDEQYIVGRVKDQDPEFLRYLEKIGIIPGVKITIIEKAPFNGPVQVKLEDEEKTIGFSIAEQIYLVEQKMI